MQLQGSEKQINLFNHIPKEASAKFFINNFSSLTNKANDESILYRLTSCLTTAIKDERGVPLPREFQCFHAAKKLSEIIFDRDYEERQQKVREFRANRAKEDNERMQRINEQMQKLRENRAN